MPPLSSSLAEGCFCKEYLLSVSMTGGKGGMVLTPTVAWIHLGVVQICSPDARVQWVLTFFVVVAWPSHPSGYYLGQRRH